MNDRMERTTDRNAPGPTTDRAATQLITRRAAMLGGAAAAGLVLSGCMHARLALATTPLAHKVDAALRDRTLRAFVMTIVPVASEDDPNLVRVFSDKDFPFLPRRDVFVDDLRERAERRHGAPFDELTPAKREEVVSRALAKGGVTEHLYRAAILLGQAAFYGSIYGGGCAYLDVPPESALFKPSDLSYPDAAKYMACETTTDGNPL